MTTPNSELEKEIVEIIKRARFNSFHGLLENGQELAEEITALLHTENQRAVVVELENFSEIMFTAHQANPDMVYDDFANLVHNRVRDLKATINQSKKEES